MKNKYEFKLKTDEVNDSHMGLARRIIPGESILELGCSSGYLSRFLKEDLGCYVVGVDIDQEALHEAAQFCDQAFVADLDDPRWLELIAGEKFDTILCADVLEHLKNPVAVLANLKAYLNPKGRILASIPNIAHASIRLELLQGHFDYESLGILDDTHLHFYTMDGCITMFMQAGYQCYDIAFSIHDLADEVIDACLEQVGLVISEQAREHFHAPDARAYQYIIEAVPAAAELLKQKPPVLSPKPLVSSGAFYSALVKDRDVLLEHNRNHELNIQELERKIIARERERDAEKTHNQNHQRHIQQLLEKIDNLEVENKAFRNDREVLNTDREILRNERDALFIHNANHLKNIQASEQKIVTLETVLDSERLHIDNHLKHIHELERKLIALEHAYEAQKTHVDNHLKNINGLALTIDELKAELAVERTHNDNHQVNIQKLEQKVVAVENERDQEKQHNLNRQAEIANWAKTARLLDEGLFKLALQIEGLEAEKQQLVAQDLHVRAHYDREVLALRNHIAHLDAQIDRLEGVLQRVHNKVSYRAVRFIKDTPHSLVRKFKRVPNDSYPEINPVAPVVADDYNAHDYNAWLARYGDITSQLADYRKMLAGWKQLPKIAVLMPTYNPTKACLEEAIESVIAQIYPNWELCIADDASTEPWVKEVLSRYETDTRIRIVFRTQNGHISRASNSALELVTADYVALMDHDDVITPDALFWVAKAIVENPDVQLIYSDEDKLNLQGDRYGPYFKPDWNPELLMSHNFICHLGIYKTAKVRELGGFDPEFDGSQDYDLALRYVATIDEHQIKHIPRILYHWRATPGSTANGIHEKPYAEPLIRKAVERSLAAKGIAAEVTAHTILPGALRVRYKLPDDLPLVSIVIPTRNGFSLLKRCIESILSKTDYANYEIIIIDNGSDDWIAVRYLEYLKIDRRITILRDERPFNYAALNNNAVNFAKGEFIALLNNDLEVINDDWLSEMMSYAQHPEVGAVGAKLYYPNDTIQHAGVIVGLGGVAGHSHKHFPRDNPGFCGRLLLTQNLSAVTAACLVVRTAIFKQVGGFDEVNLSVAFNDVDLCLRIQEAGYWNVWTPYAEMYHYESATRGYEDTPEKQARFTGEVNYMKKRWGTSLLEDPAYNLNLALDREDFSFSFPPRV